MYALAHDAGFRARDCVCRHGAGSPPIEGQFGRAQISVILAGAFHVRSTAGACLLGAGALLLGNASAAYEFRHPDDGGDRSVVFDYDAGVLEEAARALELRGFQRFRGAAVPASPATAGAIALAEQALHGGDPEAVREVAIAIALAAVAAERELSPPPPLAHARRVARVLRYIEAHSAEACALEVLADEARLSRCHFLRVFRALTGQTPRQYVIATRLRAAAIALRGARTPITRIAMDTGFADLSHFTAAFSHAFGASPRAYRRSAAGRLPASARPTAG